MSRAGYCDDWDDQWSMILYRGAVASAIRGARGQALFRDLLVALDKLPERKLIANELVEQDGAVCALGAVGVARGIDIDALDPEEPEAVAAAFGIASALAREISFMNDEGSHQPETPEQRFVRMREWVAAQIKRPSPSDVTGEFNNG